MVLSLARDSVETKLKMQASILVGNYEFYYAVGKLSAEIPLAVDENTEPKIIKGVLEEALPNYNPEDPHKAYLKRLLERYRPSDEQDDQMKQLFQWGKTGENPEN